MYSIGDKRNYFCGKIIVVSKPFPDRFNIEPFFGLEFYSPPWIDGERNWVCTGFLGGKWSRKTLVTVKEKEEEEKKRKDNSNH